MNLFTSFIEGIDPFTLTAIIILLMMSVYSWAIVFNKVYFLKKIDKDSNKFINLTFKKVKLDELVELSKKNHSFPAQKLFITTVSEFKTIKSNNSNLSVLETVNFLSRSGEIIISSNSSKMESSLNTLASIGATAPFIGLLGTVTGVVKTLYEIGFDTASIQFSSAAPGLSSALVATAVGLFVAIPAVLAYNQFRSKIRKINNNLVNFQNQILNKIIISSMSL